MKTPPPAGGKGHRSEPRRAYRALRQNGKLLCTPQDLYRSPTDCRDDERDGEDYGRSAVNACYRDKGDEARTNKWGSSPVLSFPSLKSKQKRLSRSWSDGLILRTRYKS